MSAVDGEADTESSGHRREAEFREFIETRWAALLRTAYLLTGDHDRAEDLVQSALVRVHRHWAKVLAEGDGPVGRTLEAYVRKTIVNLNTDWWRRLGSRERPSGILPGGDRPSSADAYAEMEIREDLWAELRALPPKMRAALVLRYFEDLGEAETAEILGCSIGTVKSQCSRGLARLQKAMSATVPPSTVSTGSTTAPASTPRVPRQTASPRTQVRSAQ
jgi:RNA polymerase sigma-70 factor (sigma-E family)